MYVIAEQESTMWNALFKDETDFDGIRKDHRYAYYRYIQYKYEISMVMDIVLTGSYRNSMSMHIVYNN